jgi:hypothetical protein
MKDLIVFKGNRDLWIDFVATVKKQRRQIGDVIEPMLKEYIEDNSK